VALLLSGCAGLLKTNTASWVRVEGDPEFTRSPGGTYITARFVLATHPETVGKATLYHVLYRFAEYNASGVKLTTTTKLVDQMEPGERAQLEVLIKAETAKLVVEDARFDLGGSYTYKLADVGSVWPVY
jgi:hypothetical protein